MKTRIAESNPKLKVILCAVGSDDGRYLNQLVRRAWGGPLSPLHALSSGASIVDGELSLGEEAAANPEAVVVLLPGAAASNWNTATLFNRVIKLNPRERIDATLKGRWDWLLRSGVQWTDTVRDEPQVEYFDEGVGARVQRFGLGAKWQPFLGRPPRAGRAAREWTGRTMLGAPNPTIEAEREEWLCE